MVICAEKMHRDPVVRLNIQFTSSDVDIQQGYHKQHLRAFLWLIPFLLVIDPNEPKTGAKTTARENMMTNARGDCMTMWND